MLGAIVYSFHKECTTQDLEIGVRSRAEFLVTYNITNPIPDTKLYVTDPRQAITYNKTDPRQDKTYNITDPRQDITYNISDSRPATSSTFLHHS